MFKNEKGIFVEQSELEDGSFMEQLIAPEELANKTFTPVNAQGEPLTLYQINQQALANLPFLSEIEIEGALQALKPWLRDHSAKYYMFMCHSDGINYYTVFHEVKNGSPQNNFLRALKTILEDFKGSIKLIEEDNNSAISIWMDYLNNGVCSCFYLFPYDGGVMEF